MTDTYPFCLPLSLPPHYHVHDFTSLCKNGQCRDHAFSIGRYNEARDFYTDESFRGRDIHLGIDFGAPEGTPVHSVADGNIYYRSVFENPGDYGGLIVTQHQIKNTTLYCVFGHVGVDSLRRLRDGDVILKNQYLCDVGGAHENGGWPPHLHFQICTVKPAHGANIPGVFARKDLETALAAHPDPQLYFGKLY